MIKQTMIENFKDYGKVLAICNGTVEAYVTIDIGPRIIRYGYVDGQNFMCDNRNAFEPKCDEIYQNFFGAGRKWENLGGHRIWLSPESYPETYYPCDESVVYELTESGAIFTQNNIEAIGISVQLEIKMSENGTDMQVLMQVKNTGNAERRFAIWGLTVSAQNGVAIIPMNTNDTGLLSNRIISVWPYTDMSDNRIYWGKKYVTLRQDPNAQNPIKLGFDLNCGKVYYVFNDEVFCKSYETEHPAAIYPDGGCSFETYTNSDFIELESLSKLYDVKSGETVEMSESWSLSKKPCDFDFKSDISIDNLLEKL